MNSLSEMIAHENIDVGLQQKRNNSDTITEHITRTGTHSFTWRLCQLSLVKYHRACWFLACLSPFATILYYNFLRRNDKRLMRLLLSCGQLCQRCQRSTCTKICMRSNRQLRSSADSNAAHRSCSHTGEQHTAFLSFNFVVLSVLCSHKMCRAPYSCISIVSVADSGKVNGFPNIWLFTMQSMFACMQLAAAFERRWCCLSIFTFKMNRETRLSANAFRLLVLSIVFARHHFIQWTVSRFWIEWLSRPSQLQFPSFVRNLLERTESITLPNFSLRPGID